MDGAYREGERASSRSILFGAAGQRRLDRKFLKPSRIVGYCQALANIGVFVALLYAAGRVQSGWQCAILAIAIGFSQHRLFFPLHDCIHYSLFPSKLENGIFGVAISSFLGTSFNAIRSQHMDHHRLFGKAEDPGAADYYVRFRTRSEFVIFILEPLWGAILFRKLGEYFTRPSAPQHETTETVRGAESPQIGILRTYGIIICSQVVACALVTGGFAVSELWRYPVLVVLPLATIFLFLIRLRMFLEHGSLDYEVCDYIEGRRPTARTIYGSLIERVFLCGSNFNYHHEHHLFPVVPGWQLPRLHKEFDVLRLDPEDVRYTYCGALFEIWRNIPRRVLTLEQLSTPEKSRPV